MEDILIRHCLVKLPSIGILFVGIMSNKFQYDVKRTKSDASYSYEEDWS